MLGSVEKLLDQAVGAGLGGSGNAFAALLRRQTAEFELGRLNVAVKFQIAPINREEDHEAGATSYAVDHSSGILLMNPAGQLHGVFPTPHRSELMANDLLIVLETS